MLNYRTFFIYIVKEYFLSFLITYMLVFSLFFVNQIIVIIQELLQKGIDIFTTLRIAASAMPIYISMALPFGVLLGTLLAVGRFSTDNEMVAFQSLGLKLNDVFAPILTVSFLITIFAFWCYEYLIPIGYLEYRLIYDKTVYANPNLILEPNTIQNFSGRDIITGKLENNKISNILIFDKDEKGSKRVINGKSVYLLSNSESGMVSMHLEDAFSLTVKDISEYNYFNADNMQYNIVLDDVDNSLGSITAAQKGLTKNFEDIVGLKAELHIDNQKMYYQILERYTNSKYILSKQAFSSKEIVTLTKNNTALKELFTIIEKNYSIQRNTVELLKKIAWPIMCMIFAVIGFGTGIFSKRSGKSVGLGVGGILSVVYYFAFFFVQRVATSDINNNEYIIIFLPNVLFLLFGIIVFYNRTKV